MVSREAPKKKKGGKDTANLVVSVFDRQVANALDKIVASVPDGHWLRSAAFDQVAGPVKSFVESWTREKGEVAALLGEKATDYLEMARRSLVEGADSRRKGEPPRSGPPRWDWREKFREKAWRRLERAASTGEERDRLLEEFALLEEVMDAIDQAIDASLAPPPEPERPAPDPNAWKETSRSIREFRKRLKGQGLASKTPRSRLKKPTLEAADLAKDVAATTAAKTEEAAGRMAENATRGIQNLERWLEEKEVI